MGRLNGKVAVITGGGSGIGRQTAITFAKHGAKVVVADLNEDGGNQTVQEIKDDGGEASFIKTNVSEYNQVEEMVDFTVSTFGTIDVIFNNAGIAHQANVLEESLEDYHRVINVNQHGVVYGIMAAGKKMKELGVKGTIINTASVWGIIAQPNNIAYNTTKAAIIQGTKTAALDLAPYGIRVIAIAPGTIKTPILDTLEDREFVQNMLDNHIRKDAIEPERVADVVAFLASNEADVINGTVIPVDDGYVTFKRW